MVSKKVLFGFLALSVFVMMLISVGSAIWPFDSPQESPVDVGVNVQNAAPSILFLEVRDLDHSLINSAIPNQGTFNNVQVSIIVEDANGANDLPGGTDPIVQCVNEVDFPSLCNLYVSFKNPGALGEYASTNYYPSSSCTVTPSGVNQVEYLCTIPMEYYYEAGTNWLLDVKVSDISDTVALGNLNFVYQALYAFNYAISIGWGSIGLNLPDQSADNPIWFLSEGNKDYLSSDVIAQDLSPTDGTGDNLPSTSFSAGELLGTGACSGSGGTVLTNDATPVIIPGITLPYGRGAIPPNPGENMYFCIWEQLDTLGLTFSAPSYTSGVVQWQVNLNV